MNADSVMKKKKTFFRLKTGAQPKNDSNKISRRAGDFHHDHLSFQHDGEHGALLLPLGGLCPGHPHEGHPRGRGRLLGRGVRVGCGLLVNGGLPEAQEVPGGAKEEPERRGEGRVRDGGDRRQRGLAGEEGGGGEDGWTKGGATDYLVVGDLIGKNSLFLCWRGPIYTLTPRRVSTNF